MRTEETEPLCDAVLEGVKGGSTAGNTVQVVLGKLLRQLIALEYFL